MDGYPWFELEFWILYLGFVVIVAFGRVLRIAFGVLAKDHVTNIEKLPLREIVEQSFTVSKALWHNV